MRTTRAALTWLRGQHDSGSTAWYELCLALAHSARDIPAKYPTAWDAWQGAKDQHAFDSGTVQWSSVPVGAPLFYKGGSQGFGHVATFVGVTKVGPLCWTNDARRRGGVDMVSPVWFEPNWGLTLVGATGDLNGQDLGLDWGGTGKHFPIVDSSIEDLAKVTSAHGSLVKLKNIQDELEAWAKGAA